MRAYGATAPLSVPVSEFRIGWVGGGCSLLLAPCSLLRVGERKNPRRWAGAISNSKFLISHLDVPGLREDPAGLYFSR